MNGGDRAHPAAVPVDGEQRGEVDVAGAVAVAVGEHEGTGISELGLSAMDAGACSGEQPRLSERDLQSSAP